MLYLASWSTHVLTNNWNSRLANDNKMSHYVILQYQKKWFKDMNVPSFFPWSPFTPRVSTQLRWVVTTSQALDPFLAWIVTALVFFLQMKKPMLRFGFIKITYQSCHLWEGQTIISLSTIICFHESLHFYKNACKTQTSVEILIQYTCTCEFQG